MVDTGHSPSPKEVAEIAEVQYMDFYQALKEMLDGKMIFKADWIDPAYFTLFQEGQLRIHKPDGQFYNWILSDSDVKGIDYKVVG